MRIRIPISFTFEFVELRLDFFSSKEMINRDGVSLVIDPGMVLQQVLVKVQRGRKFMFLEIIYQTWLENQISFSLCESAELFYHLLSCDLAVNSLGYQWFLFF